MTTVYGLQSLKSLQSGLLQKKLADPSFIPVLYRIQTVQLQVQDNVHLFPPRM